ncbi:hypothetical protein CTM88_20870 [Photobacterium aquimaris]|uniref:Uncharacterized protein n=1 Tax=Photobacterium aquimaris TaxID=512643 RepID=A0A2T3IEA1_9GAMM|nr:hypothetical protein AYY20_20700 [Photobacterium aquimaris]PSU20919.1 hypothetical protein CTM88_20870 [Photobacterium aquimaris]
MPFLNIELSLKKLKNNQRFYKKMGTHYFYLAAVISVGNNCEEIKIYLQRVKLYKINIWQSYVPLHGKSK